MTHEFIAELNPEAGGTMADSKAIAQAIRDGRTSLGIEFGSTRIKAVLIDDERNTITTGD
ncbi:ATPase, partial [Bifidobacterium breve]|nr:ATPase [Bifidobacterium breve]